MPIPKHGLALFDGVEVKEGLDCLHMVHTQFGLQDDQANLLVATSDDVAAKSRTLIPIFLYTETC
jgi:hypothetical protein